MGKLQTAVNLPKRILLQGWANDEGGVNINGEYTYTINFDISIIEGGLSAFYNGYKHNTLNSFIYFLGGWEFLTTADPNQWDNPSTNNVLPLTGWIENNAQGSAGTITILEDINTKISIKKQNTGSGKIIASKLSSYSLSILSIGYNNIGTVFPGDANGRFSITFTVPNLIRSYIISYQVDVIEMLLPNADLPTFSIFTTNLAISSEVAEIPCYLALRIRGVGRQPNSFTAWSPIFIYGAIGPDCE